MKKVALQKLLSVNVVQKNPPNNYFFNFPLCLEALLQINNHFINNTEYEGAIDGLLRLQDAYRLNTSDIVQGILKGVQYE